MNIKELIDELLLEASVYHPIPDFNNPEHIDTLLYICEKKGYDSIAPIIKEVFLTEAGTQTQAQKLNLVHLGRGFYGPKKGSAATHRSENGKIVPLTQKNTSGGRLEIDKAINQAKEDDKDIAADPYQSMLQGKEGKPEEEKEKEKTPEEKAHDAAINTPEKVLNDPKASSRSIAIARAQKVKNNVTAASEKESAEEAGERPQPEGFKPVDAADVVEELPDAKADTFIGKSDLPDKQGTEELEQFNTDIARLAKVIADAKEKGGTIPNVNLCQVSVPGTNLYCDGNLGIPRDQMPQFKGKPIEGSQASKMPLDQSGEVDTEPVFKEMLKRKGIKTIQTEIPADKLKATQSELVAAKVLGMMGALEKDPNHPAITAPIYVSRDGYVVDGHHRWAAVVAYNAKHPDTQIPMRVTVIDDDIKNTIPMANKFAEDIGIAAKKADANKETATAPATTPSEPVEQPEKEKGDSEPAKREEPAVGTVDSKSGSLKYPSTDVPKAETPAPPAPKLKTQEPASDVDKKNAEYGQGKATSVKPNETPKVTDDEVGTKAKTKSGKVLYHIGGGYYSDSPNGVAKYIRVESVVNNAFEIGTSKWWSLLFEGTIQADVDNGQAGTFTEIPKSQQDAATKDAKSQVPQKSEEPETSAEEVPTEINLSNLNKKEVTQQYQEYSKTKRFVSEKKKSDEFFNQSKKILQSSKKNNKGFEKEIDTAMVALEKLKSGASLSSDEKKALSNWVRIVEPAGSTPNIFKLYVATSRGNFSRSKGQKAEKIGDVASPELAAIRNFAVTNGVEPMSSSAFGGKKSTANKMYVDQNGNTKLLDTGKVETKDGKPSSVKIGNLEIKRLDENEPGIDEVEKAKRARSNRNLDDYAEAIKSGDLSFIDMNNGVIPDSAENRNIVIKSSIKNMVSSIRKMGQKAAVAPDSVSAQILNELESFSELDPNQNPEEWYRKYKLIFSKFANDPSDPSLKEAWANCAEIWDAVGKMQGEGKGTKFGACVLLPESTTLETVDIIVLTESGEANRTIVTVEGISVKKGVGGASALGGKVRNTEFRDDPDGEFKETLLSTLDSGAEIYSWPDTYEQAEKIYANLQSKGSTSPDPFSPPGFNKLTKANYNALFVKKQSNYKNGLKEFSVKMESEGRIPKGTMKQIETDLISGGGKTQIDSALLDILKKRKAKKMDVSKQTASLIRAKLENYYRYLYITHEVYNRNIDIQDFGNDSIYSQERKDLIKSGEIEIHSSDGINTISYVKPEFNVGFSVSGKPGNNGAGRMKPRKKGDYSGWKEEADSKPTKPKSKKAKKKIAEILNKLPKNLKERIVTRLRKLSS